ncbi:MAG: rod shape-determining protein MreC [Rhodoferax sp.]|jgi:rod shape-determining protein MreC
MPLGTLDGTPPSFFRQGPSALSKLAFFSALALFLMVADARFEIAKPVRVAVATALYPLQWLTLQPVLWAQTGGQYLETLQTAQANENAAQVRLDEQSLRANQVEQLVLENSRLRQLLALRERVSTPAQAAQVLYDAADPFTRKVIIDRGSLHAVAAGSPVVDETGVLGQVTRVYPMVSEVTLVTDRDQAIPVLNTRTGSRGVAFGDASSHASTLELRFISTNADVQVGDLLTTSGVDGIYPPGLQVALIKTVEQRVGSAFSKITCQPLALVSGVDHVMVLQPLATQIAARPLTEKSGVGAKK